MLIRLTGVLGSGEFGTVSKGVWENPMGAMDVAVKQLQPGASEEEKVKFLQEGAINGQFRHPNVVKLMGVVTTGEPVSITLTMAWRLLRTGVYYVCKFEFRVQEDHYTEDHKLLWNGA